MCHWQREMGPALRPTPLSPACGPRRALDAWRLQYCPGWAAIHRPALAPVPVPSGALGMIRGPVPNPPGGSETGLSTWASSSSRIARRRCENLSARPESPTLPTLRPRGFIGLKLGEARGPIHFHPSTARLLAVASIRFQNPLFLAGLSAFVSEGPIPVSMSGRCAARAIRARSRACTYPLPAAMPVDKGG